MSGRKAAMREAELLRAERQAIQLEEMQARRRIKQQETLRADRQKWLDSNTGYQRVTHDRVTKLPRSKGVLNSICGAANFGLLDDTFNIKNITLSPGGDEIYYKGVPATIKTGRTLGRGSYGQVELATLYTHEGNFKCAVKSTIVNDTLEETIAYGAFPEALTCDGVVNYIPLDHTAILMPIATGTLHDLITVNLDQAIQMVLKIGVQLSCLLDNGVKYFDVKPANILYYCRQGEFDLALADIGSTIPINGYYPSTYRAYPYQNGIPQDVKYNYVVKYYTYLLLNCIAIMAGATEIVVDQRKWPQSECEIFLDRLAEYETHPVFNVIETVAEQLCSDGIMGLMPFDEFLDNLALSMVE